MDNTVPVVRFVKCPKCFEILAELPEIPVYKCGGCGTVLRAKARSSSEQNLSSVSVNPAPQNSADSDIKVSDSNRDNICEERSLRHEQNEIKDLVVSDFNGNHAPQNSCDSDFKVSDSSRDNICEERSLRHEQNEIKDLVVSDFNGNPAPQNSSDSDLKDSDSSRDNICEGKSLRHEQNEIKDLVVSDFNGNPAPQNSSDSDLKDPDSSRDNICQGKSLRHEQNEIKDLVVSDFNGEIHEAKRAPLGLEGTNNREILEEDNEELENSPNVNSEAYGSQKFSDTLEESSEPMVNAANSEDMFNMELGNGIHFGMTSRSSSPVYEGSVSSTEEDRKDHIFRLSRRTFRNKNMSSSAVSTNSGESSARRFSNERLHSAANGKLSSIHNLHATVQDSLFTSQTVQQNWFESENQESASSPAKDAEVKINQISSEQYNQVNILSRVDELRNELRGLFNETTNNKESSLLDMKASQFQGKIPSKEYRSSLIPFSRQHSSSCFHNFSENRCCHNEHCRPCPHNICCHLSEPSIPPLHKQSRTINQEPQNLQIKVSRTQNMVHLCRPVSGGAPFVICYKCFRLLQLPVDFLVTPKRVNNLRCGGCSQVLKYFFRPRSQSMPQTPVEDQHPPSEENGELNFVAADENLASPYNDVTAWDPISSSESNSSEVEPALHKSWSLDEKVEDVEGGCFNGLKLHNLMGYSSATELLFSNGYSHDEY